MFLATSFFARLLNLLKSFGTVFRLSTSILSALDFKLAKLAFYQILMHRCLSSLLIWIFCIIREI